MRGCRLRFGRDLGAGAGYSRLIGSGASPEELAEDPALRSYSEDWRVLTDSVDDSGELWRYRAPPEAFGWRGVAVIRECAVVADMLTLTT